ncbi:hypothetical protein HYH03_002749 [Edaphochlamys debaryana]|uniref:Apple domain-containing protein n=1 Tax=Edaphochlamys debaryana TaxID=47281 RepID=A0A836C4R0_9CHLO|nr:hypothetical protein HYH03_002749 [Edaphochlamys debaryana]|eukprot:KAG2499168.1 hypothetical protein HYH03_002749 [Edaphochlamys debaryana]
MDFSAARREPLRLLARCAPAVQQCSAALRTLQVRTEHGCDHSSPAALIAVAARDVEGGIVSEGDALYLPNITACRDACASAPGCNLWIYCAAADGCMGSPGDYQRDLRKYRQCWLKYDKPTVRHGLDTRGLGSKSTTGYGTTCIVDSSCHQVTGNQPPDILDTDLDGQVLNDGDNTYRTSTPQRSAAAGARRRSGCNGGELKSFRQCWLKNAVPTSPQPKGGYGNSTGWISGLRMAWLPKD